MGLSQATLATQLQAMTPTSSPGAGESALAIAYGNYMHGAIAGAVPIIAGAVDALAVPPMIGAMTFTAGDTSAQGATQMVAGLNAFWNVLVGAPAAFFAAATGISKPGFAVLATALASTFDSNTSGSKTLVQAAAALAADIHPATDNQGTATFAGPPVLIT